jgi:hypothetical protein
VAGCVVECALELIHADAAARGEVLARALTTIDGSFLVHLGN